MEKALKVKKYNSLIRFINKNIELILSREDKLSVNYFGEGTEALLDEISETVKTVADIEEKWEKIVLLDAKLRHGWKGLKTAGIY